MKESELNTAFLISGGGTTAEAAIRAAQEGEIPGIRPVLVISSRSEVQGLVRAEALKIPSYVIKRSDYPTSAAFGKALLDVLTRHQVDLVSQNGWLAWTPLNVIKRFDTFIANQHPATLDPGREAFGGQHMVGVVAICSFIAYSWVVGELQPQIEATTHHVTAEYDQGPLIRIARFPVPALNERVTIAELETNSIDLRRITLEVQEQLLPVEHANVIETLRDYGRGEADTWYRDEPLIPEEHLPLLGEAKQLAISLFRKGVVDAERST